MNKIYTIYVKRQYDIVKVCLMKHKTGGWSFINLTKKHICPCIFNSVGEAIEDLINQKDVVSFTFISEEK